MEGMNNTLWLSFPSVIDTQDTLTKKNWEVVYTGGTEAATACISLSIAFIHSAKQSKIVWLISNFGEVTGG